MVIIFSHLTGRFHVPWTPPPAALQENWFFGDSPFAHTLWQIHDVACIFLPILHRWRNYIRFNNWFDAQDGVFLLFWVAELALLVVAGTHARSCGCDPVCRAGCSNFALVSWKRFWKVVGVISHSDLSLLSLSRSLSLTQHTHKHTHTKLNSI